MTERPYGYARDGDSRYSTALIVALVIGLILWANVFSWAPVWVTLPTLAATIAGAVWIARLCAR